MSKTQGIYKIRNCINGKVYIGQSIDIEYRWKVHKASIKSALRYPLYLAFRKYGINNFEFVVIEEVAHVNLLDLKEQIWMDYYQCYKPEFGYNTLAFASSAKGYVVSDETKKKISLSNKGKKRSENARRNIAEAHKGQVAWNKGKFHTEESKLKISKALVGRKLSDAHKQKLSIIWKGKKHTEASKLKISLSKMGLAHTEESKLKMSLAKQGKKRKPHSEESKLKIMLSNKGKKRSEQTKLKLSQIKKEFYANKKLGRKRLTIEDLRKLQCNNIIQFKKAM